MRVFLGDSRRTSDALPFLVWERVNEAGRHKSTLNARQDLFVWFLFYALVLVFQGERRLFIFIGITLKKRLLFLILGTEIQAKFIFVKLYYCLLALICWY